MWTQPMSKETWSHGEKFVVFHHTGRQLTNTAHNPQKVKQQAEWGITFWIILIKRGIAKTAMSEKRPRVQFDSKAWSIPGFLIVCVHFCIGTGSFSPEFPPFFTQPILCRFRATVYQLKTLQLCCPFHLAVLPWFLVVALGQPLFLGWWIWSHLDPHFFSKSEMGNFGKSHWLEVGAWRL